MRQRAFGELELAVVRVIEQKHRVSVRDVFEALGAQGSYTTIMTVMARLAHKGELVREKVGKQYFYWKPHKEPSTARGILHRIKEKAFGGRSANMVHYLLDTTEEISTEELDALHAMIEKKRGAHERD